MNFVIVDVETTGGSPKSSKITELVMYKFNGKKIIDEYATLINPELTLDELRGDLREIAEDLVSSGYLRLDPTTTVRNFVETIFGENGKIPVPRRVEIHLLFLSTMTRNDT